MRKILKALFISTLAALLFSPGLGFAEDVYFMAGPSVNLLMIYNPYGRNLQTIFPAIDIVGGIEQGRYSYELGYTTSLSKDVGYDELSEQKIKVAFSNLHVDLNKNINYSYNLNLHAGIGAGLLNTKVFSSKYDFETLSRTESSRFTQSLQGRANVGAQYNISKEFHANVDLSGQSGSIDKPMLLGASLNLNYTV